MTLPSLQVEYITRTHETPSEKPAAFFFMVKNAGLDCADAYHAAQKDTSRPAQLNSISVKGYMHNETRNT